MIQEQANQSDDIAEELNTYKSRDDLVNDSEGDLVNGSVVPKPVSDTIVAAPVTQNEPIKNEDDFSVATEGQFGEPIKNAGDS